MVARIQANPIMVAVPSIVKPEWLCFNSWHWFQVWISSDHTADNCNISYLRNDSEATVVFIFGACLFSSASYWRMPSQRLPYWMMSTKNLPVVEIFWIAVELWRKFLYKKLHSLKEWRRWWWRLLSHENIKWIWWFHAKSAILANFITAALAIGAID